jgi:hypothetical protein
MPLAESAVCVPANRRLTPGDDISLDSSKSRPALLFGWLHIFKGGGVSFLINSYRKIFIYG